MYGGSLRVTNRGDPVWDGQGSPGAAVFWHSDEDEWELEGRPGGQRMSLQVEESSIYKVK